jgi:hypothetical protein
MGLFWSNARIDIFQLINAAVHRVSLLPQCSAVFALTGKTTRLSPVGHVPLPKVTINLEIE